MIKLQLDKCHTTSEQNTEGETPFHLAAEHDEAEIFESLLADTCEEAAPDIETNSGLTAYDYAVNAESSTIVDMIIQYRMSEPILDQEEKKGADFDDPFEVCANESITKFIEAGFNCWRWVWLDGAQEVMGLFGNNTFLNLERSSNITSSVRFDDEQC
jgi:hypothetical protein